MPKLLIVEDNEENRDSLAARLQCRGFDVVVAGDGKMGIDLAQSEKPDLVLMDLNMPVMDGWEAIRQIRAAIASLPVIVLIEDELPGDRQRAMDVGCTESHNKPIEFPNLLAQIEALLQSRAVPPAPFLLNADALPDLP